MAELNDLQHVGGLLFWDQRTKMPPAGSESRAEQVATLGRIAHERLVDPAVGRLLEELRGYEDSLPRDSFEASLIRVTRHDWEKATCVPPSLTAEMRRSGALGFRAWNEARAASDFSLLAPHLERNLELKHRYVACFPPAAEKYDILLDDYESEMKTAEVRVVFDELKRELVPFVRDAEPPEQASPLELPRDGQERLRAPRARPARLRRALVAPRRDGAPVHGESRSGRRTPHHPLGVRSQLAVRRDPRVRTRCLRARHRPGARPHPARRRRLARAARVAEPNVGEPRRSQPPVLAVLLPTAPERRFRSTSARCRRRPSTA